MFYLDTLVKMKNSILFLCLVVFSTLANAEVVEENRQNSRIVMGEIAKDGEFPWHASIQNMAHVCSGIIVAPRWVLTVATCVVGLPEGLTKIRYNSNRHNSGGTVVQVDQIVPHPYFDRTLWLNNIALIRTQADMINVKPVVLANQKEPVNPGVQVIVSGWGIDMSSTGVLSAQLKKVKMNVIQPSDCAEQYDLLNIPVSEDTMICAGNMPHGGESICHGDFGGPAYQVDSELLYGIGSFAASCGLPNKPSVFTRVGEYRVWIQQIAGI